MKRARDRATRARVAGAMVAAACLSAGSNALAYRPFDGTDAAVAEIGEFEAELGSAYTRNDDGRATLALPATVLNLGFARHVEGVVDFKPMLAALKRNKFDGYTSIFMHPSPRGSALHSTVAEVSAQGHNWTTAAYVTGPYAFEVLHAGHWLPEKRPDQVASLVLARVRDA